MRFRTVVLAAGLAAGALAMSACSVANTAPDSIGLHYSGGSFSSQKFQSVVQPGTREVNGPGDHYYYYPVGQRTFKFSTDEGSDSGPLTASTKDQQELVVKGTITFTLNTNADKFTDSDGKEWPGGKLQKFHEMIGRKYTAYSEDGNVEPGEGWDRMLGVYIKDIADRAIDNEALKYGWADLYNSAASKAQWEKDVVGAIPALVKAQAGEDFFTINNIVLQKPEISDALKSQLTARQTAIQRAETAKIDAKTATSWPGGPSAYAEYQRQLAVNKAIESGQVKVIPIPAGSNVIVPVQ